MNGIEYLKIIVRKYVTNLLMIFNKFISLEELKKSIILKKELLSKI